MTNAKPTCVLFYRLHTWPFHKHEQYVKGIDTITNLSTLITAVNEYNSDITSKYTYNLCLLYNNNGPDKFYNRDSFSCLYHVYDVDDVREHGFLTNKCDEFKAIFSKLNLPKSTRRFFNGKVFWFNGEYGMLDYFLRRDSNSEYYWNIESDCYYNGSLSSYLRFFDDKTEDYLTSRYTEKSPGAQWHPWWNIVAGFDYDRAFGSYFPVFRLSKKAMQTLVDGYIRERAVGYCEALVPTYLNYKGLSCHNLDYYNTKDVCTIYHLHRVHDPVVVG